MKGNTRSYESKDETKRRVVVCALLGWAGASPRHLQKYSEMVKQEWNAVGDLRCIESVMPVAYIFSPLPWPRRRWAMELLESISETVAGCDSPVILLYAFSNGGAFVVEQLCALLQEPNNSRYFFLLLYRLGTYATSYMLRICHGMLIQAKKIVTKQKKKKVVCCIAGMKPFGKGFAGLFLIVLQPICTQKWHLK